MRAIRLAVGLLCCLAARSFAQEQTSEANRRALSSIVLPAVDFHNIKLEDAVEFLRQDAQRSDPTGRGINISLRGDANRAPVSLTLTRLPLGEALRYVASQAGLKVRVEPYAVLLVPLSDPDAPLVTASFRVSPNFFGPAPAK